ncbi:hypothetical protein PVL30_004198 [Lodderomyces elongisporus]|uniref:uncharacterized protein n=1 Tax=Lodderomyces elongisporus TaxID=36914 RepID=UPI002924E628|nr:uncharacterized protein PVL30_004198 [Lodderomyces elongisporus]WLF80421.1 hypothetical protein PVL30_004198 [Lodderomyces elongisporus]
MSSTNEKFPTNVTPKYIPFDKDHEGILSNGDPKPLDLAKEFKDSTVIVTAIPGSFTKVCSTKHIPAYIEHIKQFKEKGVKNIIVFAVNDPFVQASFGKALGYKDPENFIIFATDPDGKISQELGEDYVLDLSKAGMGLRLERYAAIVVDGYIKYLASEQEGNFTDVSSPENLLKRLPNV